jgi:hypothetical protein
MVKAHNQVRRKGMKGQSHARSVSYLCDMSRHSRAVLAHFCKFPVAPKSPRRLDVQTTKPPKRMVNQCAADFQRTVNSICEDKTAGALDALALCLVPDAMFDAEPEQAYCRARSNAGVANVGGGQHAAAGDVRVSVVVDGDGCGAGNGRGAQRDIEGGVGGS